MWEETCGAVPVVDEQSRPVGFLTDRDICMGAYTHGKPLAALRAETAMARKVVSCAAEDDVRSAAQLMRQHRTRRASGDQSGWDIGWLALSRRSRLRSGANASRWHQ
jgi:CBS domain-containing protein